MSIKSKLKIGDKVWVYESWSQQAQEAIIEEMNEEVVFVQNLTCYASHAVYIKDCYLTEILSYEDTINLINELKDSRSYLYNSYPLIYKKGKGLDYSKPFLSLSSY